MSLYDKRGVSAQKEDVHKAVKDLDQGLYPYAFCKLYPDYLTGSSEWVNVMHADGAGTKSILAYLYWKETGDISIWRGIAQDAIAMNLDDLLCVGIYDNILFSSTIDRNKNQIPGEVLTEIINGTQEFFDNLESHGVRIKYLGGETADVGDLVRTIAVNGTMSARWEKNRLVTNEAIQPGNVIIGIASFGKSTYEHHYNSGIGSNGLTSARHDLLSSYYITGYPETFEGSLDHAVVYSGPYKLSDPIPSRFASNTAEILNIGKLILSPTRTYAPFLKILLEQNFPDITGLIHCSGGGQTKCLKYLPSAMKIVKDSLFEPPAIFKMIQDASGADNREMYQVFNMGHRLEIFTTPRAAAGIQELASSFGLDSRLIGRVEAAESKELIIDTGSEKILFHPS